MTRTPASIHTFQFPNTHCVRDKRNAETVPYIQPVNFVSCEKCLTFWNILICVATIDLLLLLSKVQRLVVQPSRSRSRNPSCIERKTCEYRVRTWSCDCFLPNPLSLFVSRPLLSTKLIDKLIYTNQGIHFLFIFLSVSAERVRGSSLSSRPQ